MNILAIETSMRRASVALRSGTSVLVKRLHGDVPAAEHLVPLIGELMTEGQMSFSALGLIAVCVGPGGFSGIRTGVAAARGIALAANVPVAGATSFRIMAAAFRKGVAFREEWRAFGLVAPAGINLVYCQILCSDGEETPIQLLSPRAAADFLGKRAAVLAGPAAGEVAEAGLPAARVERHDLGPDAETLAEIASRLDPERDLALPLYVRPADAKPQTGHGVEQKSD